MTLTSKQVRETLIPWPIKLPEAKWDLKCISMTTLKSLKTIWEKPKGKRHSIRSAWLGMEKGSKFADQRHYCRRMAHDNVKPSIIIVYNGIIIDGNHTAISLMMRSWKRPILILKGGNK